MNRLLYVGFGQESVVEGRDVFVLYENGWRREESELPRRIAPNLVMSLVGGICKMGDGDGVCRLRRYFIFVHIIQNNSKKDRRWGPKSGG